MVELLSPVGNKEMLYQAIHNGADAVYLAGKNFGARKFADNFNNEELEEAIYYSHLYGVKVYVTVNTIIYEDELDRVIDYIRFLHKIGVDALIMQDIGLIKMVRDKFPNLEIHASTQCHNHNDMGLKLLKDMGVTRVVLDREMTLEEIKSLNTDIEKEVFVHGALCVSYSGCCLFSSLNGGRSGNRGECVGSCRLCYKLVENDKIVDTKDEYLLSTRELNTLNHIGELIESGINSFKIEGRMKSPSYVGYVTRLYRKYIDRYYNKEDMTIKESELYTLKKLYNRMFTDGYLFKSKDIMNISSSNHQGVVIGKVVKIDKKYIYMELSDDLAQNDGIRFKESNKGLIVNKLYDKKGLLVNKVTKGSIALIDNKIGLKSSDIVLKTLDYELENELTNYPKRKIKVTYKVYAYKDKKLIISICDGINNYSIELDKVMEARSVPVTREDITRKLAKLGNTIYELDGIDILMDDNIFIPNKVLNEARRMLTNKLDEIRTTRNIEFIENDEVSYDIKRKDNIGLSVLVRTEEQLKVCLDNCVDYIYVTDYSLYQKYKKDNVYFRTSRVFKDNLDIEGNILATEIGSVNRYKGKKVISDYYLNIVNSKSIDFLENLGVERVTLSPEISDDRLKLIDLAKYNTELIVYGRLELMLMKYCPLKLLLNNCSRCKGNKNKYYLQDKIGNKYPIIHDNCLTHIMHYKNLDLIDDMNKYINMGINTYRLELFDEDEKMTLKLIHRVKNKLK